MYQVVEIRTITAALAAALLAVLLVAGVAIGWVAKDNASLRTHNAELLKSSEDLLKLNARISASSNRVIDHVAQVGLENMALTSHACGSRTTRDSVDLLRTLSIPGETEPVPAHWLLPDPTEPEIPGPRVAAHE